ncbi:hypothetical protein TNCV_2153181 [Trichonephila clavipes]|nr:hypothetical protein TNCV_2153181 [Trichonephila clavipes]
MMLEMPSSSVRFTRNLVIMQFDTLNSHNSKGRFSVSRPQKEGSQDLTWRSSIQIRPSLAPKQKQLLSENRTHRSSTSNELLRGITEVVDISDLELLE